MEWRDDFPDRGFCGRGRVDGGGLVGLRGWSFGKENLGVVFVELVPLVGDGDADGGDVR